MELRYQVFCVEQGVTVEADRDGLDPKAEQLVAEREGRVVGTCRLLIEGRTARLGRMVVSREVRGQGVGGLILAEADRVALARGATRIQLHAQVPARGVYDRAGYLPLSAVFVEEGIEHLAMEKQLA